MVRYLIPAFVMVGALVVLLAGAVGNLTSLPDLGAELSASIARIMPGGTQAPPQDATRAAPPSTASSTAATEQPATDTLQQQVAQLQQQVDQRKNELTTLRTDEDAAQHALTSLQQQRQTEEAAVARLQAQRKDLTTTPQSDTGSAAAQPSAAVAQQQAANAALQKQSDELSAQIKQQSDQLATLRTSEEQERHALYALRQQRQVEEAAVTRLQSQQEQLATAQTSTPPPRPRGAQQTVPSNRVAATTDTTQTVVAELRARQRVPQRPPPGPEQSAPGSQPYPATQPVLIVSTKGVLVTARELLASGRVADARQLLMRAQAESALRPVTPDQPYATGASVVASQIGDAIHFLDSGNSGRAMQAIDVAMNNASVGSGNWPTYPQAPAVNSYASGARYDDGATRR